MQKQYYDYAIFVVSDKKNFFFLVLYFFKNPWKWQQQESQSIPSSKFLQPLYSKTYINDQEYILLQKFSL